MANPNWKKGVSGNPNGRPPNPIRTQLDKALKDVEKRHKKSIIEHALHEAYKDNTLLAAILRKLLPDLKSVEAKVSQDAPFRLIIDMTPVKPKPRKSSKADKRKGRTTSVKKVDDVHNR
jgi:hypothetical protein